MKCSHVYEDGSTCKRNVKGERCWQHADNRCDSATVPEPKPYMRQFKAAGVTA